MEPTCDYPNCEFAKQLFDKPEQCPFFIESWWQEEGKNKPVLIKDCSSKRTFLMIQDLHNRLIGVQKAQEQQRNENVWVQVVAKVLGKNSGIDLEAFVEKRQQLQEIERIRIESKKTESLKTEQHKQALPDLD